MGYTLIKKTSPNSASRGGTKIVEIVLHHWGARGQSFDGVVNWLCNKKSEVSAHYVAQAEKVAYIVDESRTAYHAGNWSRNLRSIGIECRPEATDADYQTVGELIAGIWKRHGRLPIVRHKDIVPTACPGVWDISRLVKIAESVYSGTSSPVIKNPGGTIQPKSIYDTDRPLTVKEAIMAGQAWGNKLTGSSAKIDGIRGPETVKLQVKVLQWAMNSDYGARLVVDGDFGPATSKALGQHYVGLGETQYMVTALEVLLLLNGYNPHGVERPGTFGQGVKIAVGKVQHDNGLVVDYIAGRKTFLKLID